MTELQAIHITDYTFVPYSCVISSFCKRFAVPIKDTGTVSIPLLKKESKSKGAVTGLHKT